MKLVQYMSILNSYTDYSVGRIPPLGQLLYFRLFLINNRSGWCEWFGATNQRLLLETGIGSEKTLIANRNILKQCGLIDYKAGRKGQPTQYKLLNPVVFTSPSTGNTTVNNKYTSPSTGNTTVKTTGNTTGNTTVKNPQNEAVDNCCEATNDAAGEVSDEAKNAQLPTNNLKDNDNDNDVLERARKKPKKRYGEFVTLADDEYAALLRRLKTNAAVDWCIEKLDNYKGSSGKKYKSDYRAILNWVVDEWEASQRKSSEDIPQMGIVKRALEMLEDDDDGEHDGEGNN